MGTSTLRSILSTIAFAAAASSVQSMGRADVIADPLNDWQLTSAHSPGLVIDSTNPDMFFNDAARVKCADGSMSGSFEYHIKNITAFRFTEFTYQSLGKVDVYSSPDHANWSRCQLR
jgi:hypothetical protein